MIMFAEIAFLLLAYISGAVPYGYILTKKYTGKIILQTGSGNIGSTNVARVAGKKISIMVQLADMLKGLIPVLCLLFVNFIYPNYFPDSFKFLVAFATILGHNYSVFLIFKGGKGVNTTLGASVLLAPIEVFSSVAVFFIVKWRLKYVSMGSIALASMLPLTGLIIYGVNFNFYYLLACAFMILFRHKSNIKRLITGAENL